MNRRRAWGLSAALCLLGASAACRDAAPPPGASAASTPGAPTPASPSPGAPSPGAPSPGAPSPGAPSPADARSPYLIGDPPAPTAISTAPTPDWLALGRDEALCADCHPEAVAAWRASPMGRSLAALPSARSTEPSPIDVAALLPERTAGAVHPAGRPSFAVATLDGRTLRFAEASPAHGDARTAAFVVGSGAHTRSFFWRDPEGALWLLPLTWYRRLNGWDLSPGYVQADQPGLYRPIGAECLTCHADPPPPPDAPAGPGSGRDPGPGEAAADRPQPTAIGCARCHGDARAHAAARLRGEDAPVINPARLPPDRARAVCEQCHLQGAARLTHEGRTPADFRPGDDLASVFAVFERAEARDGFGIASHAARLRRSRCFAPRGAELTCTQCHHPHGAPQPRTAGCVGCHRPPEGAATLPACAIEPAAVAGRDCVDCHLRRAAVDDIPHVAVTDHWIRRRPEVVTAATTRADVSRLVPVYPAPEGVDADLLLGRAYAEVVRAEGRPEDLERALAILNGAVGRAPRSAVTWRALAFVARTAGVWSNAERAIGRALALTPPGAVAQAVGWEAAEIFLRAGDARRAWRALGGETSPMALAPAKVPFETQVLAAQVLAALGRFDEAAAYAEAATAARPGAAAGWMAQAVVARARGDHAGALVALAAVNTRAPAHRSAWLQRLRVLREAERWAEAEQVLAEARVAAGGTIAPGAEAPDGAPPAATQDASAAPHRRALAAAAARLAWARGDERTARAILAEVIGATTQGAPAAQPGTPPAGNLPPDAVVTLAALALDGGDHRLAIAVLRDVVAADPTDGGAWTLLARAHTAAGDPTAATQARFKAQRLR